MLSELEAILPPPSRLGPAGAAGWAEVEQTLGLTLPDDYKIFVDRYGIGSIDDFLWVLSPFTANANVSLINQAKRRTGVLRFLRDKAGEPCPYPLFPERGGLLPFAVTDNGDVLYWLTSGKCRDWHIVVNAARDARYELYQCATLEFIHGILTGQYRCSIFPDDFPSEKVAFRHFPV